MSPPILQTHLPDAPWMAPHTARLPGVQPAAEGDWLRVDEAYGAQMARREALVAERQADVIAALPGSEPAQAELLETVLEQLSALGFQVEPGQVARPDGRVIALEGDPLPTLARLVQEDFCLLEKSGDEHLLSAAVLAFPASWTLAEKIGRPLTAIHIPVDEYDPNIAARVQRMFDAITPGRVLWRANALLYDNPELFQPRRESDPRLPPAGPAAYLRSERQCLLRLPKTGAVVFSIHTVVVPQSALSPAQAEGLARQRGAHAQ